MLLNHNTELIYHILWQHALIGVALFTKEGDFIAANPSFCKLTEYTEAELKTKKYQDITHPDDMRFDQLMASELLMGKIGGYDMPKRYLTKFGRVINMMSRVSVVNGSEDGAGDFVCFVSQMAPLSEHQISLPEGLAIAKSEKRPSFSRIIMGHWPAIMFALGLVVSIIVQVLERVN